MNSISPTHKEHILTSVKYTSELVYTYRASKNGGPRF
jgi:hypothetical protein